MMTRAIMPIQTLLLHTFFENARLAYERMNSSTKAGVEIPAPQYFGDVSFSIMPQQVRRPAPPSWQPYLQYTDFIYRGERYIEDATRETAWKQYLENGTENRCSLQGLVVQEIVDFEPLSDSRFWSQDLEAWLVPLGKPHPSVVARSIREGLEKLHSIGIQYGLALDMDSIWLQEGSGELRGIFTNFSLALASVRDSQKLLWKKERELRWWRKQADMLSI